MSFFGLSVRAWFTGNPCGFGGLGLWSFQDGSDRFLLGVMARVCADTHVSNA